ncbi:hypothetical protein [Maritimibacter alkaliphilus]|jgi:hypothetical protein|nr:hypothetical protein [Maritimibacter alkaliphilus]MBY6089163.1 hypothetical protein [Maritimibacter alkaliphilus]
MTNRIAIVLALLIVALLTVDAVMFDWANALFLAKKLTGLIEWMAFWR